MPGIRLVDVRAALAALGLAGLAALAVAIVTHLPAPALSGPATHAASAGLSRLQALPMQAQSVMSSTIGGDARAFAARHSGSGWQLSGGGVRADFRSGAPTLTAGGSRLSLSLTGVPAVTSVTTHGNRVTLVRPGVREWYAAGPLGIEQGFTLAHRLAGSSLALGVTGGLRPQATSSGITFLDGHGRVVLRYGGLTSVDASGRRLPSSLAVRDGRVVIAVNDRGARYPVTIDPLLQQGGKLVPNDAQPNGVGSQFGDSVAISADGNTALIGGQIDNSSKGAVWVFTRSAGAWSQLGSKIVPTDEATSAQFGTSVALSTDGSTALIGGELDAGQTGAAWVYIRSGSGYTEQARLVGNGELGPGQFGHSVALSGNGNTALIGAPDDRGQGNAGVTGGAAWVFSRSVTTWSAGTKIAPALAPNTTNDSGFGTAVALSSDGTTAFIGGPADNAGLGSVAVYTGSGSSWSPQPSLKANDAGTTGFGAALDISADGSTAVIGGPNDNTALGGGAWVFTRSGSTWSQQGPVLQPINGTGPNAQFGSAVAISSDGNTALIGSQNDSNMVGAAYLFTRSAGVWAEQQRLTSPDETGFGQFGSGAALSADGQTAMIGAFVDNNEKGAAFAFAPPAPVCNSVSATAPQGGGSAAVALSCTLPFGAHPTYSILGGPSNGKVSSFDAGTGQVVYTSAAFFSGQDSFTYRVSDQWGISNIATATLTVPFLPVPTCSNVTAKGKRGATKVTVTLKCKGPAGHFFSYGIVSEPSSGKLGKVNQSNGKLTYTTHVGFGGKDRFVYNATDSGGSSKAATATVVFPRLFRVSATMNWLFQPTTATHTVVDGMIVKGVPGGAKVLLSCKGKGCPIRSHTAKVAKHKVCKGKGKKRKCRMVVPKTGNVDLTRFVRHAHVKVGAKITVAMVEPGWIGKEYVFTIRKSSQPSNRIVALAPGSTRLCPTC